ncbi:hypothetical protein EVAR_19584_1 [Eumeta japonica]|uniref:Uncharacterized protein n=1 Tax=Eumeta variegata TaxID=151549 RepID=A0A4C1UGQ6_EUMVA|nr:hypothetical protein EVAR_19584_1 [Eumeta japonica]
MVRVRIDAANAVSCTLGQETGMGCVPSLCPIHEDEFASRLASPAKRHLAVKKNVTKPERIALRLPQVTAKSNRRSKPTSIRALADSLSPQKGCAHGAAHSRPTPERALMSEKYGGPLPHGPPTHHLPILPLLDIICPPEFGKVLVIPLGLRGSWAVEIIYCLMAHLLVFPLNGPKKMEIK